MILNNLITNNIWIIFNIILLLIIKQRILNKQMFLKFSVYAHAHFPSKLSETDKMRMC